jgi:hypothetical protein
MKLGPIETNAVPSDAVRRNRICSIRTIHQFEKHDGVMRWTSICTLSVDEAGVAWWIPEPKFVQLGFAPVALGQRTILGRSA